MRGGDRPWAQRSRQRNCTLLVTNDVNNSLTGEHRDGSASAGDRDEVVPLRGDPSLDAPFTITARPAQRPFRAARAAAGDHRKLPVLSPCLHMASPLCPE